MKQAPEKLLTPIFALLMGSGLVYFTGMSMLLPVLPAYVGEELGGSDLMVGLAMGVVGVSAVILRLLFSQIIDIKGRRWTIIFGATAAALGIFGLTIAKSIAAVVAFRLLTGLGEAAFFVGLIAAFGDLAPDGRKAEVASYFSAAVYLGFAIGPIIGEHLWKQYSFNATWAAGGIFCAAGALLAVRAPQHAQPNKQFWPKRFLHPAALAPASVAVVGLIGFAAFITFAAPWATQIGIDRTGSVFMTFACVVLGLRIGMARLPDRLGARTMSSIALATSMIGLGVMALWHSPTGLFLGTVVLGCGQSFFFPALLSLTLTAAPFEERGQALGTFSASFDLSLTAGAILAGAVSDNLGGISSAFWMGSMTCATALVLVITRLPAQRGGEIPSLRES